MTSPPAAHTGIVDPFAGRNTMLAAPTATELQVVAEFLVDTGHASWCPVCDGAGVAQFGQRFDPAGQLVPVTATCTRCRGGRLNPFHGCTFTTDDPCACTTRCQAYQPQETPTP